MFLTEYKSMEKNQISYNKCNIYHLPNDWLWLEFTFEKKLFILIFSKICTIILMILMTFLTLEFYDINIAKSLPLEQVFASKSDDTDAATLH